MAARAIRANNSSPRESPEKHRYIIAAAVLLGVFMFVLDGSVVSIALPTITRIFSIDVDQSEWVITAYFLTLTSLFLIFGKASEITGKKTMFLSGFVLFILGSFLCGLSTSLNTLVLFRVIQAVGAAMAFSISFAIIFLVSPEGERGRAMGYIGSTVAIAAIAGPVLGGFIVSSLGWEYIFFLNVPPGLLLLILTWKFLPSDRTDTDPLEGSSSNEKAPKKAQKKMDLMGAAAIIICTTALMVLVNRIPTTREDPTFTISCTLIFLTSLAVLIRTERMHENPILNLSIINNRLFVLPCLTMLIYFIAEYILVVLGPFYFEGVMGYTPAQVGTVLLIIPAITILGAPFFGWMYDKHYWRYYAAAGMAVMASSLILVSFAFRIRDLDLILLSFIPLGVGYAIFQSPNTTEILIALPEEMISTSSSFTGAVRNLGMGLGVSIGSLLVSIQLDMAGYSGSITGASPELLSISISNGLMIAGLLCILGMVISAKGSRVAKGDYSKGHPMGR